MIKISTLYLTKLMYQNVSDEAISAGDSASFIISQLTAFGDTLSSYGGAADQAQHVIDSVNEVANNFAVSSGQIATNLGNMSAVMSQTGSSFEESLGMLTAITEVTRNASKASRGLVSIGSRIVQIVDDSSSTGKALKEIYEGLGIALYDSEGQLRSSYDILYDLSQIWNRLDTNTQNYIASQQAGTNQFQTFAALMSNFSTAVEATATAMNSAGSAAQENSAYMESLNAKTQQLKATFEDFSNNVIESDLVKSILDLANNALSALNTETGATITQWTLLTGVLTGGITIFGQIAGKLVSGILNMGTALKTLGGVITGATTGVAAFASAALPVAAIVAGIAVVGYNLYKAWKKANPTLEEAQQKVQDLETELQTNQERLEEINAIPWYDRTEEMKAEKEELEKLNAELEENLELAKQQRVDAAKDEVENKRTTTEQVFQIIPKADTEAFAWAGNLPVEEFSNLKDLIQYVAELTDNNKLMEMSTVDAVKAIKDLGFEFNNFSRTVKTDAVTSNEEFIGSLNSMLNFLENAQRLGVSGESIDEQIRAYNKENVAIKSIVDAYKLLQEQGEVLDESALELIETYDEWVETSGEVLDAAAEQDRINNIVANGIKVNAEEMAKLARTYPELAGNMATANGEAYILTDTLLDLAASGDEVALSMAKAAQAMLRLEMTEALSKRNEAFKNYLDASNANAENVDELKGIYEQATSDYAQATTDYYDLLAAIVEGNQTLDKIGLDDIVETDGGGGSSASKAVEDILQPLKDYLEKEDHKVFLLDKQDQEGNAEEIINIYKNAQKTIANYANALRAKGYAEDSEQIRELQELWWGYQDEIDSVYDAIEDRAEEARQKIEEETQKQIDALTEETNVYEKLFNYMVNQIDKEIEALEAQRDAEEQLWDDKIDALQEQNDEIERQIELEQLQDQLARARQSQVLVYKDGRFQYVGDIDEVSEAQKNLEDYEREEALRQETENLEKLKEEALAAIDEQIEGWEKYKEEWSSVVEDYQEEQDRLMIEQELGIKLEGEHWKERLDNLQEFVDEYRRLMNELLGLQNQLYTQTSGTSSRPGMIIGGTGAGVAIGGILGGASGSLAGGAIGGIIGNIVGGALDLVGASGSSSSGGKTLQSVNGKAPAGAQVGDKIVTGGGTYQIVGGTPGNWESIKVSDVSKHAKGTLSAPGGPSIVGENGPELRWINPGDGILPANVTKNLWGWGSMSPSEFMSKSSGTSVVIQNLNLPNVRDPQDFTNYLKNNFWRKTVQFQTSK